MNAAIEEAEAVGYGLAYMTVECEGCGCIYGTSADDLGEVWLAEQGEPRDACPECGCTAARPTPSLEWIL